jgi:anti-sigma regulatory factor (Ser/Thr protein kinase)
MGLAMEDHESGLRQAAMQLGTSLEDLVRVRQSVRELLADYPADTVADAVLVADALASNAFLHGSAPAAVRIQVSGDDNWLRVEAADAAQFELPVVREWSGSHGLGMRAVSMLASSWGVERHARRKTVWAEMELVP